MKTIGLIGGMSWESTALYYRLINEAVKSRLGGLHSAKLILASVDFHEVAEMQRTARWDDAGRLLAKRAAALQAAGAEIVLIGANTMHKVAPQVAGAITVPLLHVGDVTADAIAAAGCRRPALLGTRYTMEDPFYAERLATRRSLAVCTPGSEERAAIHRVIYEELCRGAIVPASREIIRRIIAGLVATGADSVVLGCTELALLIRPEDSPVPIFDTTALHAIAAVEWALAGQRA